MANQPLQEAIDAAGSQSALAALVGVSQGHVWYWLNKAKMGAPAEQCAVIEAATGVSKHRLRPDIFGSQPAGDPETSEAA